LFAFAGPCFEFGRSGEVFTVWTGLVVRKHHTTFEQILARLLAEDYQYVVDFETRDLVNGLRKPFTHDALLVCGSASADVTLKNCHEYLPMIYLSDRYHTFVYTFMSNSLQ
jgi:hypothetical protein